MVGSSRKCREGFARRERAQHSLRLLPPERWEERTLEKGVRSRVDFRREEWKWRSMGERPFREPKRVRCWSTVRWSQRRFD